MPTTAYAERIEQAARWRNAQHPVMKDDRSRWWQNRHVIAHVRTALTGDARKDWYAWAAEHYFPVPAERGLCLGSGRGGVERKAVDLGIARAMDGVDLAGDVLREAAETAERLGYRTVRYLTADLNAYEIPEGVYDVVIAREILHHLERLDEVLDRVVRALRPGGLLIAEEYVGPNRFRWRPLQAALAREILSAIPEERRRYAATGDVKREGAVLPGTLENDPTEAVRSEDILPLVRERFDRVDLRPAGGTLAQIVFDGIMHHFDEEDPRDVLFVRSVLATESALIRAGVLESDYVLFAARRRS